MPRGRILSRSISTSARIESISEWAQVLFDRLVIWTDDFGRMEGSATFVKAECKPLSKRSFEEIADAIAEMVKVEAVTAYVANGKLYLFIPKHDEHQIGLHKRTSSKHPEPGHGRRLSSEEYRAIALAATFPESTPTPAALPIAEDCQQCDQPDKAVTTRTDASDAAPTQKKTRKKTATHMTPEWRPTGEVLAQMQAECPAIDVERALIEFRDWWIGEGRLKADWNATFRNRIRQIQDKDYGRSKHSSGRDNGNRNAEAGADRRATTGAVGNGAGAVGQRKPNRFGQRTAAEVLAQRGVRAVQSDASAGPDAPVRKV